MKTKLGAKFILKNEGVRRELINSGEEKGRW